MWEKGNIAVLLSNDWQQVINKNTHKKIHNKEVPQNAIYKVGGDKRVRDCSLLWLNSTFSVAVFVEKLVF